VDERISVRARFERFPATVKGAFIARVEDGNPHQISYREARVRRVGGRLGAAEPLGMKAGVLDIPPHQDVFLPFEFSIAEYEPGWYGLEIDLDVDGASRTFDGGRRFAVPWPRGAVRRGQIALGRTIVAGNLRVGLEQVDVGADTAVLRFSASPPEQPAVRLTADGEDLPELETSFDGESGEGRLTAYPVLRAHRELEIRVKHGREEASAGVRLPE
jgi:hypothetical protein